MSGASASTEKPERPAATSRLHDSLLVRAPLLALSALALLTGLCGGLWRIGWTMPHGAALAQMHGPLLISGLFGTLVGLERAVALGRGWSYAAPALSGLGTLVLLAGAPISVAAGIYALAAAVLAAGSILITYCQPALFTGTLLVGALAWLAGNLYWALGGAVADVVGWWLAFLVLTILAARLELSRLNPSKWGSEAIFLFALGILLTGAQNGLMTRNGAILFGVALLVTTGWLLRHDIAWMNVRRTGQTRYIAACMLVAYLWLAVAGAALIAYQPESSPFGYDIALHAILIGFVLSTLFGHALVVLPALVRLRVSYSSALYVPLVLLHASVALRVGAGVAEWASGRLMSGPLTALALAGFAATLAIASRRPRTARPLVAPGPAA